jgi:hypothetical protein
MERRTSDTGTNYQRDYDHIQREDADYSGTSSFEDWQADVAGRAAEHATTGISSSFIADQVRPVAHATGELSDVDRAFSDGTVNE